MGCVWSVGRRLPTPHLQSVFVGGLTCSLMLLMPSGPSRLTACFTRSVRPQLSILKPRSCRNLASVEAASSFRVAQKQSSALQKGGRDRQREGRTEGHIHYCDEAEAAGGGEERKGLSWKLIFKSLDLHRKAGEKTGRAFF